MFDDDEGGRNLSNGILSLYKKYPYESWKKKLIGQENFESIQTLFDLFHLDTKHRSELVNLLEVFSLLENVFRNAILLPYIPAYRSINIYCGRYQSFVHPIEKSVLFDKLNFKRQPSHLLTYVGTNQLETMRCAQTCAYIYHLLKMELENRDRKKAESQRKETEI
jgi:hypothetical protein